MSSTPNHLPYVFESLLKSTATSNTEPFTARTSFACGYSFWKWSPRSTPFVEHDWLSCTNTLSMPASCISFELYVSIKYPRLSPCTVGSMMQSPSIPPTFFCTLICPMISMSFLKVNLLQISVQRILPCREWLKSILHKLALVQSAVKRTCCL